ncbi:MAG: DAK2 domain-containing protein [Dysosmobacter welbionis]
MTRAEFAARLKNACAAVTAAEAELTEIDSKFGDADHGLTMAKIAGAISEAVDAAEGGIQSMLDDAAMAVMTLNGGSAVPLWNTWLDGLQEEAPEGGEIDVAGLKAIFAKALEELEDMSGAKVGDKTMMDALIPASEAVGLYRRQRGRAVRSAAQAAAQGRRLRSICLQIRPGQELRTKTIGTPDAGAVFMSWFFQGLARE